MKRILHVVGAMPRAGAESMVMNLYRAIDKTQYQFDFVYFTDKTCDFDDEIIALGGKIYRIPDKYSNKTLARTYQLYRLIKNNKPFHAVHAHQLFSNAFHLLAAYFAGIDMRIAHSHNTSDANSKSLFGRLYQNFSRKLIRLVTTNYIACGDLAGKYLFPKSKNIVFIPNAVDIHKFLDVKSKRAHTFFKNESITKNTIILSQIGRLMPVKNVEFSIDFMSFLKQKNIDFHFFIVGQGKLQSKLENLVAQNNLTDRITFLGVRSDIDLILGHTDVLLMPSFHEGFPVILVESQTAGVPALISDAISKEVDLGLNLINFQALKSNFETWEIALQDILSKSECYDNSKRHHVLREKRFDIEVSVKTLEGIYN